MASAPLDNRPVLGRLDRNDRLVFADPELEALQREAGSDLGNSLALPQIAAIADLARKLGIQVTRPAVAAAADHDVEMWVRATPEGDEIALSLEGWIDRPAAGPKLSSLLGGGEPDSAAARGGEWSADEELKVISLSSDLAEILGVDAAEVAGQPLTRVVKLEESDEGDMPLISALAARRSFSGQRARSRTDDEQVVLLSGEVVTSADGSFAGFRGKAEHQSSTEGGLNPQHASFDLALDEVLRSPLDRIIESAERIVERADGPLRSDYASYGTDIAAAARHLLSVIRSMSDDTGHAHGSVDLAALSAEAVVMLDASAEERGVTIELSETQSLQANGQERAVIQILVNLMANAIRHSPRGGTIRLYFARTEGTASVTVADEGTGIAAEDQQRIFERFERAQQKEEGGTGLGLAISRRLARSMGGDVTLDSPPGEGARFTLTLPAT